MLVTPPSPPSSCVRAQGNTAVHDNMRKSIHGFPLVFFMGMGLRLRARSSAIVQF